MTVHPLKFRTHVVTTLAAACLSSLAIAQDYPPAPPISVRLAQAPEPTLIGPVLPGVGEPTPVAPLPVAPPPNVPVPASPTPVAPLPEDLPAPDPSMAVPDADVEAFARGPVHEAFADVYDVNPVTGEVVATAPPAAVDELPPEQAPTGQNVQWIAGYWSWDTEAKDYFWVSGVWRDVPPGRRWVPGYWAEVTGGFQWVGGFWADAQVQELTYVPPPPESLEVGPNVPPPSDDQIWVPGNWTYVSNDYRWSPGYYTPCQTDYMWVPNQYCYTPRGYVYVPGYWDYRFARRGTLFTPVRFRRSLLGYGYARPACYRPRFSVNMSGFMIHLFVRPRYRNYYYGDYYGNQYASIGFTPWYRRSFAHRHCNDPALSFYRWDSHRRGIDFDRSIGTWHQRYESNVAIRPPRLIQDQDQFLHRHPGDRSAQLAVLGHRFDDLAKAPPAGESFRRIEHQDVELLRENSRVSRHLETARRQIERDPSVVRTGDRQPGDIVDLRPREVRDRLARDNPAVPGDSLVGRPNAPKDLHDRGSHGQDKLVLTDLPEKLKERTRESVATADRIRQHSGQRLDPGSPKILPATRDSLYPTDRTRERANIGDANRPGREPPHRIDQGGSPNGTQEPGAGGSRLDEIRQRIEERRSNREAGPAGVADGAPRTDVKDRAASRIPHAGPAQLDSPPNVKDPTPLRNDGPSPAAQRIEEIRQQAAERRHNREIENSRIREAPMPDATRQPRAIERNTPVENSAPRERVIRERDVTPRINNPAPVIRHQPIERAPVERAPRVERAPIQQAPRQIDRAPVERAPRVERAPVQRHAPVERAPRAERAPAPHRRGKN